MAMAAFPGRKSESPHGIDRYELIDQLGEGGMGVVWRALDTKTGSDVAIKIMKDISDSASLQLFAKEWKALAELSHPNIVDVRDVDVFLEGDQQRPFFVMPLLRGATLAELIDKSSERLTVARVVEIMNQVCRGLQAAHQQGLIHRDLKPSNIFVMDDDTAKIIDFGVVYLAGSQTVTGQKGTCQYMSPEQIQMKEIAPSSDIFALGVILYESLTGRKPFAGHTNEETMQAVLKRIPPSASELNPTIPLGISQVVHKCLAKQPFNRFSSATELAETLRRAFRNEPIFDVSKLRMRVERAKAAFKADDVPFASELLSELESEGHLDPEITVLRMQIEMASRKKRIEHLLASARARIDQEEIPLGLDKLRELLELDPENSEALTLKASAERRRNEKQAGKWVELAKSHLHNFDIPAARHAVREALTSRPGDREAIKLLGEIDAQELEAKRVREQKEQLYGTAKRAYENGEIDSALARLDRLFSMVRSRPEGAAPERDAVYESFYKEVCSEHDTFHSQFEDAQRQLVEENFGAALATCNELLTRYPNNGTLQALKIEIEDAERQRISADLATTSKNADAEPDLDRRANIWREASERYPQEPQFAKQWKATCERRDLVNSIVAKAHQFSERGQYNEELNQWEMLRKFHPRYPGLEFELEHCRKKRDLQVRNEEKAQIVQDIVGLMEARNFAMALERSRFALREFSGDAELLGLEKLSQEGLERSQESNRLLEAGQGAAAVNDRPKAIELLQEALRLDPRNSMARDVLINVLIEEARSLLASDLISADRLYEEARALDANHRLVRSMGTEISEANQQKFVGECLTEARGLLAIGNAGGAYDRIRDGRKKYPKDLRLKQFENSLLKDSPELQLRHEQVKHLERLEAARQSLEHSPDLESAREVLRLAREIAARNPAPEAQRGVESAEQTVRRVMSEEDLSHLLRPDLEPRGPGSAVNAGSPLDDDPTRVSLPDPKPKKQPKPPRPPISTRIEVLWRKIQLSLPAIDAKGRKIALIAAGSLVVLVSAGLLLHSYLSKAPQPGPQKLPQPTLFHIVVSPADSVIKVDGVVHAGGDISVPAGKTLTVGISHAGYQGRLLKLDHDDRNQTQSVILPPLPTRISVATVESSGFVEIDGARAGDLTDGSIDGLDTTADGNNHTIVVITGGRQLAKVEFQARPGQRPAVSSINTQGSGKGAIVVSSLNSGVTVYGGEQLKSPQIDGAPVKLRNSGLDVAPTSDEHELTYDDGGEPVTLALGGSDWPSLSIRFLGAGAELVITSNVDTATLTANGAVVKPHRHSWRIDQPGTYDFVLSADQYEPQTWTATLKPKEALRQERRLEQKVIQPSLSSLVITGGTPGAKVEVDSKPVGEVSADGTFQLATALPEGSHQVRFQKEGLCGDQAITVVASPPADAHVDGVKLDPCASITLQPTTPPASVKVFRSGDPNARWISLTPGIKTFLAAGIYQVAVEQPPRSYSTGVRLEAGRNLDFAPIDEPPNPHCALQNPDGAVVQGDWMKAKNPGGALYLSPGCVNVNLVFAKLKASLLGRKHVEWEIETPTGDAYILWDFDGEKLSRKGVAQDQTFDQRDANVQNLMKGSNSYDIRIRVDGKHVRISNGNGATLDDYTPDNPALHDLAGGRVSIKTPGEFKFSGSSN